MRCPSCAGRGAVSSVGSALERLIGRIRDTEVDLETFRLATKLYAQLAGAQSSQRHRGRARLGDLHGFTSALELWEERKR